MAMLQLLLSKQDLAEVKAFVVMTGEVERGLIDSATAVLTWKELLDRGHQLNDEALVERQRIQAVNKACMLIYTSGTTGPPKGLMIRLE
jgi:long-chain-fatty-acid--CoA ligase ACSBG